VIAVGLLGLPSQAADRGAASGTSSSAGEQADSRTPGYLDARQLNQKAAVRADRERLRTQSRGDLTYQKSLGTESVADFDPLTDTPRSFGRLDGYLTGPSTAPAKSIALGYVGTHLSPLGLTADDLSTLRFRSDYVDALGVHNLSWSQSIDGTPVFGNGLKVKVTRDGRVLAVQGSPISGLAKLAAAAPSSTRLSADAARTRAASNVGGRVSSAATVTRSTSGADASKFWSNHDYAKRVWILTKDGLRPAWSTYVQAGGDLSYQHVVDAATGKVLFRRSTVDMADGDTYVYDYYPGATFGGQAKVVNLIKRGWLNKTRTFLNGQA
jgi:extracellular elastinolytic metalloproteinase